MFASCGVRESDSVRTSGTVNSERYPDDAETRAAAAFLVERTDALMAGTLTSELALERATRDDVKLHASDMLKDQPQLLSELRAIGGILGVSLPERVSDEKAASIKSLSEQPGAEFDRKFLDMMRADHQRDVAAFRKAMTSENSEVRSFAARHIQMVEGHLNHIEQLSSR